MEYEIVIGLEVHAQLKTDTKMFCSCSTAFGAPPNTNTCQVCLGMPGVLPVVNKRAVEYAIKAALALNCEVHLESVFSRKNYFYPDLTKGYQISQFDKPLAERGEIDIETSAGPKRIGITRIHLEEDAGKSQHLEGEPYSLVDYNRCGVPLIEIVSEPDMRSTDEAVAYLKKLRQILRYLDVCDGNMEEGSLRCDANISLRPLGQQKFGTRSELKNINSFRFVQRALEFEIERHRGILESGGAIVQETRLFDHEKGVTYSLRSKEESHDYRYFPEPDLVPLRLEKAWVQSVESVKGELPDQKVRRYVEGLGLPIYDAGVLTAEKETAFYFEACVEAGADPKKASNWVMVEVARELKERNLELASFLVRPADLATLIKLIDQGKISGKIAKAVFSEMAATGKDPESLIASNPDYQLMEDSGELESIISEVLAKNTDMVAKYKAGNERLLGALIGQIMKATKGKADPQTANRLLMEKLKN